MLPPRLTAQTTPAPDTAMSAAGPRPAQLPASAVHLRDQFPPSHAYTSPAAFTIQTSSPRPAEIRAARPGTGAQAVLPALRRWMAPPSPTIHVPPSSLRAMSVALPLTVVNAAPVG